MEKALFIMPTLTVTQGYNVGTHRGALALDLAGEDSGIDWVHAPFTGVVRLALNESYGKWLWLESVEPVLCANGEVTHLTLMIGHDNRVRHKVGDIIKQGERFFAEGTSGNATGNHVHIELGKGKFVNGGWYPNGYNVWMIHNAVAPHKYLAVPDNWTIKQSGGLNWVRESTVKNDKPIPKPSTADQVLEKGSVVTFAKNLRVEMYRASDNSVYNTRVGGWLPASLMTEDSAKDGAKDNYFANTNATFTIDKKYTVGKVVKRNGVWDAWLNELGCWVHCDPLVELQN